MKKKIITSVCIVLSAIVFAVLGYILYVVFSYHRVEDNLTLEVEGDAAALAPVNTELSLSTYNIGFGAYSADYSFFMDGGEIVETGTPEEFWTNPKTERAKKFLQNFEFEKRRNVNRSTGTDLD